MPKLTKREQSLAQGSIYDVARSRGEQPEDVLAEADVVVMLDESSSMAAPVGQGKSRHDEAVEALRQIQRTFPGRVILITFANSARFHWNGLPSSPAGSTQMDLALDLASQFKEMDMKFYLISDGQPNDKALALEVVNLHFQKDPIHTIFIGSDTDRQGMEFLQELSAKTGGRAAGKVEPELLGETVTLMLTGRK